MKGDSSRNNIQDQYEEGPDVGVNQQIVVDGSNVNRGSDIVSGHRGRGSNNGPIELG